MVRRIGNTCLKLSKRYPGVEVQSTLDRLLFRIGDILCHIRDEYLSRVGLYTDRRRRTELDSIVY